MQLPLLDIPGYIKTPVRSVASRQTRQSAARNEWQTPQPIIRAVVDVLGAIDLDPCSNSNTVLNISAKRAFRPEDDSLLRAWSGRIWLNPPFGRSIGVWVNKLVNEYEHGDCTAAIALVPARTDAPWWGRLGNYPFCAIRGKITFVRWDRKNSPSYTVAAVYLGPQLSRFSSVFSLLGTIYIPYTT
ncbi:MAG TPA: DNA N-6-adenine-methyltransferase [Aggregatilineales bacterium]|nr:DNA N-6-adenine-methyltransferase [Aggregatilineales bacterium]